MVTDSVCNLWILTYGISIPNNTEPISTTQQWYPQACFKGRAVVSPWPSCPAGEVTKASWSQWCFENSFINGWLSEPFPNKTSIICLWNHNEFVWCSFLPNKHPPEIPVECTVDPLMFASCTGGLFLENNIHRHISALSFVKIVSKVVNHRQ